jgi:transposase
VGCRDHPDHQELDLPVRPSLSISDAQRRVLEPLLPPPGNTAGKGGRNEKQDRRRILDAIFYPIRLDEGRDPPPTAAIIDSASVRAADSSGDWQAPETDDRVHTAFSGRAERHECGGHRSRAAS